MPKEPNKIEIYLRIAGQPRDTSFLIEKNSGVSIDATNFRSFEQGNPPITYDFHINGYTGSGYIYQSFKSGNASTSFPILRYPLRTESPGLHKLRIRIKTSSSSVHVKLLYNDVSFDDTDFVGLDTTQWIWVEKDIVIPDRKYFDLGIQFYNEDIYIDAIQILNDISSIDLEFNPIYCTVHSKLYAIADGQISSAYPTYYAINSIDQASQDDWYMFSCQPFDGYSSLEISSVYTFAIFVSGVTDVHYVIWDLSEDALSVDPYLSGCSFRYNKDSDSWENDCESQYAMRVYSYRDSLNSETCLLTTTPSEVTTKVIRDFDDEDKNPFYLNTKVVPYGENNKVELSLPDRIVSFIIDQSGSLSWNDSDGLRYRICRETIDRLNDSYPSDIKYNILTIGGTPIKLNFFAVIENNDVNTNNVSDVASSYFFDQESGFAGIRLVRKTGSFPETPVDGDIVTEGFVERAFDGELDQGVEYYYKAYTFDGNNRFSNGVEVRATPRERDIPRGIGHFTYNLLRGSGIRKDEFTKALWHFGEGAENKAYDFTASKIHLSFSDEMNPIWLNSDDVPVGYSGVRLNYGQYFYGNDTDNDLWTEEITVAGWVFPLNLTDTEGFFSYGEVGSFGLYIGKRGSKLFFSKDMISFVEGGSFSVNEWNHFAVTINNSSSSPRISLYINGSLIHAESLVSQIAVTGRDIAIGKILYNDTNYFAGKITEVSVHNKVRNNAEIFAYANPSEIEDQDNGDRLILLSYSVPEDFNFSNGIIRIVKKDDIGTKYREIVGYTEDGDPIYVDRYGYPPYHENDGENVFETIPSPGSFTVSIVEDFVLGRKYYYKIFSRNASGVWCFGEDAPTLEISIPDMGHSDSYIGEPNPSLNNISGPEVIVGNRKLYITWQPPLFDSRVKEIKVWYGSNGYPVIEDGNSDGELVFVGNGSEDGFVHRKIPNDQVAYYSIVTLDQHGYSSNPIYINDIPSEEADERLIPLLEVNKLRYEIVNEEAISIAWENPVKFEKNIEGWFDQRVVFFAQITDDFGAPIENLDNIEIVARNVSLSDSGQAEDVFRNSINRTFSLPNASDVYVLSYSDLGGGLIKGILRLSADIAILSALESISFDIEVFVKVPDHSNPGSNSFEFYSKPISVILKNPWKMEIINYSGDRIDHLCKQEVPLDSPQFLSTLSFESDKFKEFDGTYIRRSRPMIVRVKVSYRDRSLPVGNRCFAAIHEASDPQCDPEDTNALWEPSFSDTRSQSVTLPASAFDFVNVLLENNEVTEEITVVDIPIIAPDNPQGVMLFVKASYNGFISRKKMYIVFENILRLDLTINEPAPDCVDRAEQFATCYLIDPDNPENRTLLPDLEIVRWQLTRGLSGRDRPFYSTDNVPNGPGVFSFIRNGTARQVFFGPACGVAPQIIVHETLGLLLLPEIYAVKAIVVYDGLQAYEELPLLVTPRNISSVFGFRFLMEMPLIVNEIWADGYDYETLIISHDPNSSNTHFSDCFRSCAAQYGSDLFAMDHGQIISLFGSEMEMVYGENVTVEYNEEINEYILNGGTVGVTQTDIPLSSDDRTLVYFKINKFIGPVQEERNDNDNAQPGENPCSCLEISPDEKDKPDDVVISGDTLILVDGEQYTLRGGGNIRSGMPPVVIRLKEPLYISFVDQRINGVPVNEIVVDGVTEHEFIVEVKFSGKPVPDGTPITLQIGGSNPDRISISPALTIYTLKENDPYLNPVGEERSFARFTIAPLNPASSFSSQIKAISNYDKRGDIQREMSSCVTITFDVNQTEDTDIEQQNRIVSSIFSKRLDRYDVETNEWMHLADMNYPRGGLIAEWSGDEYGEKLWAIGGIDGNQILTHNESFDINTLEWTVFSPMPTARFYHMSIAYGRYIYVFGGITVVDNKMSITRSVERYDSSTDTWDTMESMPSIGSFEQELYGVAAGVCLRKDNFVYILSGIRTLGDNAVVEDMNDRILIYDIDTDSWTYSELLDDISLNFYERISPSAFLKDGSIHVVGGAQIESGSINSSLKFMTNAYRFIINDMSIVVDDDNYDTLPEPRFRAAYSILDNVGYIIGGLNQRSQSLNVVDILNLNNSPFEYSAGESLERGRSAAGITNDNYRYLYLVGGMESGRPPGFLKIEATGSPSRIRLDGKQSVGLDITLTDEQGESPSSVRVFVKGYLLLPNSSMGGSGKINRNDLVYPVVFSTNEFNIIDGFGSTTLLARSDDILRNIRDIKEKLGIEGSLTGEGSESDILIIRQGEIRNPYKIRIQISILDDFYYGETTIDLEDESSVPVSEDPYTNDPYTDVPAPVVVENEFENCVSIATTKVPNAAPGEGSAIPGSSLNIEGLLGDNAVFNLVPRQSQQLLAPEVSYFSDIDWLPQVINVLGSNDGTYDEAIRAINRLESQVSFGGSPIYDGLVSVSRILVNDSADGYDKVVYLHTDNEENLSRSSINDAIDEMQSIDGFARVPAVINNYSIVFPLTLSALVARTDTGSLDQIASSTGGQSQTVLSANYVDEVINNTMGRMIGSIGYGVFEYTIDLEAISIINSISVDFILYDNMDGSWKISVSDDGFNYSDYSNQFDANTEITFNELVGRYVKLQAILLSSLASTSDPYGNNNGPVSPAIIGININYNIPKVSYLYLDQETSLFSAQQISVSVNANRPFFSDLDVGVTTGETFNWDDYQDGSKLFIDQYGKIFIPIRTKHETDTLNEPLENIDGFAFKSKYGSWDRTSRVQIADSSGNIIDSDKYKLFPRNGLVVFKEKQSDNLFIDIENSDKIRIGLRITNRKADDTVKISGVGYMYNTNVFLPPPLSERAPSVTNLLINPNDPNIFSVISVSYLFRDLNRDKEDLSQTIIKWFINGIEKEYLRNLRSWNDISNINDPLWKYGLFFSPDDVPDGMTPEQYARQQGQSLLKVGDNIYVTVKPFDGKGYGNEMRSVSVTVLESPPFINSLEILGRLPDGSTQEAITTGTTAFASYNFFADNNENRSTIVWYVNGSEFKRGDLLGMSGSNNNNEIVPGETQNGVSALEVGNVLQVEIIPSTSIQVGDAVRSGEKTVENQPPSVTNVLINPLSPNVRSVLVLTYTFVDSDVENNDPLQSNQSSIRWYRSRQGEFIEIEALRNQTSVIPSFLSAGDRWKASVIPFDGVSVGETVESNIVTIT